jgi:hypothetical protein
MFKRIGAPGFFGMLGKIELITLIVLIFLLPDGLQAQAPESSEPLQIEQGDSTDDVPNLDLFDEDTELTKKGWLQFYVAAGFMYLDGEGSFSLSLPNGEDVTIIDFDRAGLNDKDSSYWLALNWRSANSRWGA